MVQWEKKKKKIHLLVQEPQKVQVQSLDGEDPLEEEMATHPSILAWKIPGTEKPGWLQSKGLQKSQTWLNEHTFSSEKNLHHKYSKSSLTSLTQGLNFFSLWGGPVTQISLLLDWQTPFPLGLGQPAWPGTKSREAKEFFSLLSNPR